MRITYHGARIITLVPMGEPPVGGASIRVSIDRIRTIRPDDQHAGITAVELDNGERLLVQDKPESVAARINAPTVITVEM